MHTLVARHRTEFVHGVYGFDTIQEFEHDSGLVEGIGYRNGQLVRYAAGSPATSPFECEPITIEEALHWWAKLQLDQSVDLAAWTNEARARFLEAAAQSVHHQSFASA